MKEVLLALVMLFISQDNQAPVVRITTAIKEARINAPIRYTISVSDKEDGDTKFDEIGQNEILLQAFKAEDSPAVDNRSALHAMMTSNCMNCHAFTSKLIGPSFRAISEKYAVTNKIQLANRVKDGSKGIWGDAAMPTHPELSDDEINRMVDWILNYKNQKDVQYHLGVEGAIIFKNPGLHTLRASYLDRHQTIGEHLVKLNVTN